MLLALLFSRWQLSRARRQASRASKKRNQQAQRAEKKASKLLNRHGYRVVERQLEKKWNLTVDQEFREVRSRVDFLVERKGLFFVADVKSGSLVPAPTHPATRRQLLEYLLVFEADGALLVDPAAGVIREIGFQAIGIEEIDGG